MKFVTLCAAVLAALAAPLAAHADTYTTFDLANGTFSNGGTLSGTVVLDTTNDEITSYTLLIDADVLDRTITESDNDDGATYIGDTVYLAGNSASFSLVLTGSNTSPQICGASPLPSCFYGFSTTELVYNNGENSDYLNGGTLTAVSATPEPSSLLLLATGLSALGALRRRFRNA